MWINLKPVIQFFLGGLATLILQSALTQQKPSHSCCPLFQNESRLTATDTFGEEPKSCCTTLSPFCCEQNQKPPDFKDSVVFSKETHFSPQVNIFYNLLEYEEKVFPVFSAHSYTFQMISFQ